VSSKRWSVPTWAILGLLIERPSYGYELSARYQRRLGDVTDLPTSMVYQALDRLERGEHIVELPPPEDETGADAGQPKTTTSSRQPKLAYRATPHGARAYRDWMVTSLLDETRPTDVLARLGSTVARDPTLMEDVLREYEARCLRDAARQPMDDGSATSAAASPEALMERLILGHRRMAAAGVLPWVEYARAEIARYRAPGNAVDPRE
jgi:hypothetical protein